MKIAEKILNSMEEKETDESMNANDSMGLKIMDDYKVNVHVGFDIFKFNSGCGRYDEPVKPDTTDNIALEAEVKKALDMHKADFMLKVAASLKGFSL